MKILVIDDEELICWSLKRSIEMHSEHVVSCVNTGVDALQKISEGEYDVIITDLKLPDINGADIVRKMKEMKIDTPVIVVSAYFSQSVADDIKNQGVFRCINKPFQIEDVLCGVREAIKQVP